MMLQIPSELQGVALLDNISFLYQKYIEEVETPAEDNDSETNANLKERIDLCKSTCLNPYMRNVIELSMLGTDDEAVYTEDDVNYIITMIELLKDFPIFLEFMSLLPNIYIPCSLNNESGYSISIDASTGVKLIVHIDSVRTYQLSYYIEQLIKTILSMTIFSTIAIEIANATSIIYSSGESIISRPVVQLSSKYEFSITSLSELLNGTL